MTLGELIERLNSFDGFDLSEAEAKALINQARGEFARRSRYPRKIKNIGPTVANQAIYDWPTDFLLPYAVAVNGVHFEPSDRDSVREIERNETIYSGEGLWYDAPGEDGTRKLRLYLTPTEAGLEIEVEYVYRPADLTESSKEPTEIPKEFHDKLLHLVAATYYRTSEDNPELAEINDRLASAAIGELMAYDNQRTAADGVFQVGISGVTVA